MIKFDSTTRGFSFGEFKDLYGENCSIQMSSRAGPEAIWLGVSEHRMHLDRQMVRDLIPVLQQFVDTGMVGNIEAEIPEIERQWIETMYQLSPEVMRSILSMIKTIEHWGV